MSAHFIYESNLKQTSNLAGTWYYRVLAFFQQSILIWAKGNSCYFLLGIPIKRESYILKMESIENNLAILPNVDHENRCFLRIHLINLSNKTLSIVLNKKEKAVKGVLFDKEAGR